MTDTESKAQPRRMRFKTKLLLALLICMCILGAFLAGMLLRAREPEPVITSDLLGEQLRGVQELVSVEYYYTNMGKFENRLDFYGWKVPFTLKSFIISYDGVIRAGVDLDRVRIRVDETTHIVDVSLPQAKIISHEIPEDSIQVFDETRNLFNPITIEDYVGFTSDQKRDVESKAIENGLLTSAYEKAQDAVQSVVTLVPGMDAYMLTFHQVP